VAGALALAVQQLGRKKTSMGKDIAPACKIKLESKPEPAGRMPAGTNASLPIAGKTPP